MSQTTIDLKTILARKNVTIPANLNLNWVEDVKGIPALLATPTKKEFYVDDDWVIGFNNLEFTNGIIEFDALGKSEPPQSNFLGISFRYVDESTHDAIYFRPFNFRAEDPDRRSHAVQYISHPNYHWFDLRKDKPNSYEKPIIPAPDGDDWFHAMIVFQHPQVSVFVNGSQQPSLVVEELTGRTGGGIGLWVGPGQGGYFANLTISPNE